MAFDSFKGSLTSRQANAAAAEGARRADPACSVREIAVADGGEGTLDALASALGCTVRHCKSVDAAGRAIESEYAVTPDGDTAIIETASTIGLPRIEPELRHPLMLSSRGVGMQIADAIAAGCRNIIICIGGTATVDGGVGMLRALGARFLDREGCGATSIIDICSVDVSGLPQGVKFVGFHDVTNTLCGANGAPEIFGPQKGATRDEIVILDKALSLLADVAVDAGMADCRNMPGAGAGGGIGFALAAFLGADMKSGAAEVLKLTGLDSLLDDADAVFTGEGRVDRSTLFGKTPFEVLQLAKSKSVPVYALGGSVDAAQNLIDAGFSEVCGIVPEGQPLSEAMIPAQAAKNLADTVEKLVRKLT